MTTATANRVRSIVLLNSSYEPLGKLSIEKAVRLLALGKAVVHEADECGRRLGNWAYPKVIRLVYFVKVNYSKLHAVPEYSKHGVLLRDKHKCAYCLKSAKTIDHVFPRSRGGKNDWKNTVAACFSCNNKKDNKTPEEAGMVLRIKPFAPTRAMLLENKNAGMKI